MVKALCPDPLFWSGKKVFLTGHTGFKGGWIAHWLTEFGADVHGFALAPQTRHNFFTETKVINRLATSTLGDIRDYENLSKAFVQAKPDIVIHMAAQPLVRLSYANPLDTFSSNVIGTVNVLDAARKVGSVRAIVNITTDKCYENKEWIWPYRESDRLGGYDPYSASKACSEIVAAAYRNSFLSELGISLASVRAGNVIGGGDWATDRLIPDFLRAADNKKKLKIRSPNAVRPWQHVLEPLSGYLLLAQKLFIEGEEFAGAWNFGPNHDDAKPVSWIVKQLCDQVPGSSWVIETNKQPHEANFLKLDISKAKAHLGWVPRWNLETALNKTVEWHQAWRNQEDMEAVTSSQIQDYNNT